MSESIGSRIYSLSVMFNHSTIPERGRCIAALDTISRYLEDTEGTLDLYTATDLDIAIYKARSKDVERIKESSIIIEELKKTSTAHKHRADHFERVCNDYTITIRKYQTENAKLTVTFSQNQKNLEATQAELNRLYQEHEKLKTTHQSLVASTSTSTRDYTRENAILRSRLESLQKSEMDYSNAFKSTKKKLQLAVRKHKDLLGMADMASPMGEELDTSYLVWDAEGLSGSAAASSLLAMDGTESMITTPIMILGTHGASSCDINLIDLSDANCLV